jgi:hypothetical protein
MDFYPLELWENKFQIFSHLIYAVRYYIIAAWKDYVSLTAFNFCPLVFNISITMLCLNVDFYIFILQLEFVNFIGCIDLLYKHLGNVQPYLMVWHVSLDFLHFRHFLSLFRLYSLCWSVLKIIDSFGSSNILLRLSSQLFCLCYLLLNCRISICFLQVVSTFTAWDMSLMSSFKYWDVNLLVTWAYL